MKGGQVAGDAVQLPQLDQPSPEGGSDGAALLRLRGFYARRGKRWLDLVLSVPMLVLAAIPMAIIGLLVLLGDGRPVFFGHERIGRWGGRFRLLKFRTMRAEADANNSVTVAGDVRITRIGRYLRRWKLDELPQLLNVVRGDMSLVGPRPDVPGYWDVLEGADRELLALLPGVTGPGTLVFRGEEKDLAGFPNPKEINDCFLFPAKVRLSRCYGEQMSFLNDLKWIAYTVLPDGLLHRRLDREGWTQGLDDFIGTGKAGN